MVGVGDRFSRSSGHNFADSGLLEKTNRAGYCSHSRRKQVCNPKYRIILLYMLSIQLNIFF